AGGPPRRSPPCRLWAPAWCTWSSTRRPAGPSEPTMPGAPRPQAGTSRRAATSPGCPTATPTTSTARCAPGRGRCTSWSAPGAPTAVGGQKLLETIFGDEAVRRMAAVARQRLTDRLDALAAERSGLFLSQLDALGEEGSAAQLHADAEALAQLARDIREDA